MPKELFPGSTDSTVAILDIKTFFGYATCVPYPNISEIIAPLRNFDRGQKSQQSVRTER